MLEGQGSPRCSAAPNGAELDRHNGAMVSIKGTWKGDDKLDYLRVWGMAGRR